MNQESRKKTDGFTLIEVLVALGLFSIISLGVFMAYANILDASVSSRLTKAAIAIAEEEIEIVRNLAYDDVGIEGGFPIGVLSAQKTVMYGGVSFVVETFVRNIDDAFDGTLGGVPNDTAPADYKLIAFRISCPTCPRFTAQKLEFNTYVAPRGLENATNNGNLFINVFDANGLPVQNAKVHVVNNLVNPAIDINDETNISGVLQLVDVPTSTIAYEITITKTGYSSEQTYATDDFTPSTPSKLHSTVASQTITEISFPIDKLSSLVVGTSDQFCQLVEGVNFNVEGTKLVATEPDVKKHSFSTTTDANGSKSLLLEWDTYSIIPADSSYYFSGFTPNSVTTTINPNSNYSFNAIVDPKESSGLLITVVDNVGTPVYNSSVGLIGPSFNQTIIGGERVFSQTDWSLSNYSSQDGTIDAESLPGQIILQSSGGSYATGSVAWLISNSFVFGTSTTFQSVGWSPTSQPAETGSSSLRFQLASNNDNGTWNFIGPDGTANTYYESQGEAIHTSHTGDKYFRYQVFMQTEDTDFTPQLDNINFGYTTGCLPKSQVFFNGLESGDYIATVNKSGYNTATTSISVGTNQWYQLEIPLTPDT
jgi:prepilin-type N-terminal cleavage/methylation domain-containing protein